MLSSPPAEKRNDEMVASFTTYEHEIKNSHNPSIHQLGTVKGHKSLTHNTKMKIHSHHLVSGGFMATAKDPANICWS